MTLNPRKDLAFYGLGLNSSIVLQAIGYADGPTLYHMLYNNAVGMIILACAGSLPGYWTAVLTIDTLGRKPLQIAGFIVLTLLFCVLGFCFHRLSEAATLALYVAAQFFFNWGPNTTTFIVPGECFPTRYRSTGHGLSAAMGKVGAVLAQVISIPVLAMDSPPDCHGSACSPWIGRLMQIFALFMLCGTATSLLIPETKGVTLEELAGEAPAAGDEAPVRRGRARWNPFAGGRPAGFTRRRRPVGRQRVGIMTSPELAAQNARSPPSKRRTGSARGDPPGTASSAGLGDERGTVATPASVLPGWGAGWGRVDCEGEPARLDVMRLQDVGNLLR